MAVTYSTGSGVNSWPGGDSTSVWSVLAQAAPSRNRPCTNTPSLRPPRICSGLSKSVTSVWKTTSSSAHASALCARVTSWRMAVRKPCGLKKPVIQYAVGRPSASHRRSCSSRRMSPENQWPSEGDSHDTSSPAGLYRNGCGGSPSTMASSVCDSCPVMTTSPRMACVSSVSVDLASATTARMRCTSCSRNMFIGTSSPPMPSIRDMYSSLT
mmetsp:Transcript_28607/g.92825  ORF Transcript_28607/g.92825 Transcript_28607/m.92825 type:complete len:212 (-) Transcript_28607:489-1124(-)